MTARYLSKKALKLTDAEKTQTFENFVRRKSRQDLTETCLGHLGPSLNHPRSWFSLTILFDPRWLQENRVYGNLQGKIMSLLKCLFWTRSPKYHGKKLIFNLSKGQLNFWLCLRIFRTSRISPFFGLKLVNF